MKNKAVLIVLACLIAYPAPDRAQESSWQPYNGSVFSFRYPGTWQLHVQADRDVVIADTTSPMSVEFALSPGQAVSQERLALNAEMHVTQFARMNNMVAKFEGWNQIETGGIRVISHLCSDRTSTDLHTCPSGDPKVIDVSSIITGLNGRILLIEAMHKPGIGEDKLNVARQIVTTLKLTK